MKAIVNGLREAISGGGNAESRATALKRYRSRRGAILPSRGAKPSGVGSRPGKGRKAAAEGKEILPGLFRYQETPRIPGYEQHHLWPQAMGGPRNGWTVYARGPHATVEGIQGRLNSFLRGKLNLQQRELEQWARENPKKLLPLLREFYKAEGIPFTY